MSADPAHMSDAARIQSMQLLAQDFGDILAALRAAEDAKGHERRISTRMDVHTQVKVVPFKDGSLSEPFTCMTRDLSFKGIGLLQCRQAARGSQFVITLPKPDGASMSFLCTVMYCRTLADGIYNVGASFIRTYNFTAPPAQSARTAGRPGADELNRLRQSILR
jgi:hypothetical protein